MNPMSATAAVATATANTGASSRLHPWVWAVCKQHVLKEFIEGSLLAGVVGLPLA